MKKRILVLTDHMPWGHRSIAQAIFTHLKGREKHYTWEVCYEAVKSELLVEGTTYNFITKIVPQVGDWLQKAAEGGGYEEALKKTTKASQKNLEAALKKHKPDLVICSYFFHSHGLAELKKKGKWKFKLWTVVADTWGSAAPSFVKEADLHLVYDEVCAKMAHEKGVKKDGVLVTGWWVRDKMYGRNNKEELKKKLGLSDCETVVFLGGTSTGNYTMLHLLPELRKVNKNIGVIFNFGVDKLGYRVVEIFRRLMLRNQDKVKLLNYGWVENIDELIEVSDVVMGKGSPDILFESVAKGVPFVSVFHVKNEEGDLAIIRSKKLGWVKEKPGELKAFFGEFIKDPDRYRKMYSEDIQKEGRRNQKSLGIIEKRIYEEFKR